MKSTFQLPEVRTPPGISGGRSVREGYQRGWGLQFGGLDAEIENEPLFKAAEAAGVWSLVSREKKLNLYILITRFLGGLASRNIIEFGSYRGGNALFMATLLKELDPQAKVYALDTFAGMPVTDLHRDLHSEGDFRDASLPALKEHASACKLDKLIALEGLFNETFPTLADLTFGLAHIDCDIYPAVKYCQEAARSQMAEGGYLVYDDSDVSSCIGATEAVEDLMIERRIHTEQIWPHGIIRKF